MNDTPYRLVRKTSFSVALGLAILAAGLLMLALLVAPRSEAATGGAASTAPVPAEETEITTAFNEAELTFT
ncbi:MAG TPA: hypothetical protein VGH14_19485, partial [Solirubrobacterales bacterium]